MCKKRRTPIRKYVVPAVVLALALAAEWIGEDQNHPNVIELTAIVGGGAIAALLLPKQSRGIRKLLVAFGAMVAAVAVIGAGWAVGAQVATRAFNECVDKADAVVIKLNEFKAKNGKYPEALRQLGAELPGNRLMRANILFYKRTGTGFMLEFGNTLSTHSTDESGHWNIMK